MSVCGCPECQKPLDRTPIESVTPSALEIARIRAKLMSPIEETFLDAYGEGGTVATGERLRWGPWWIEPQAHVGPFRVDFVCGVDFGKRSVDVVIELDGHEFHQKTPEQVEGDRKRDRAFIRLGVVAMRFTGREVTRSAKACAREVRDQLMRWAEKSMRGQPQQEART